MTKSHKKTTDLFESPQKNSIGFFLLIFFLTIVLVFSVFIGWKKNDLSGQKTKLEISLIKLDEEIEKQKQKDGFNKQKALLSGHSILEKAKNYRVKWQQIYKDIINLESETIIFYSINAGRDKKFNINGISNSIDNISKLLVKLKSDPKFVDPFISQINEIQETYKFTLSFEYKTETK